MNRTSERSRTDEDKKRGLAFLRRMSEASGVSGAEEPLGEMIEEEFAPLVDEIKRDALGNLIMLKRGEEADASSVMLAAHMDEVGLMVTEVDDDGFLRITSVGGVDPRTLLAEEVMVLAEEPLWGVVGVKPPHLISEEERSKAIPMEDLFIDVGLKVDAARQKVRVGDSVVLNRRVQDLLGERLAGKALDDRAGVASLYRAAQVLNEIRHHADVYLVATVQEEVGLRGAITSTYGIMPDVGIAVDVGCAKQPEVSAEGVMELEKGPTIARGGNVHPRIFRGLTDSAKRQRISYQEAIIPGRSGTDAWAMQVTQSGVPTGVVSIPLRYMHTSVETISFKDICDTGDLLAHFAASVDREMVEGFYDEDAS